MKKQIDSINGALKKQHDALTELIREAGLEEIITTPEFSEVVFDPDPVEELSN